MPFQKGNKLGELGRQVSKKNKTELWNFIASGGARKYHEKLDHLSDGGELTKGEMEFMDRVEKLFPYVKAKLSSVDNTGEIDHNVLLSWLK